MCDCIFCKIANHEIPSTVVYEDDQVIAFDDLNPQAPVHTLVIPKKHYSDIADNVPAETMGAMAHAIQEVAKAKGLEDGFRVISNKGVNAGQTVCTSTCTSSAARTWARTLSEGASSVR